MAGEPIWLELDDVLEIHAAIIGGTPAHAADLLRNRSGLLSALERPATYAHYEGADLAMQAAVLAHGIAEGQPFLDGNKRVALIVMLTFLEVNGVGIDGPDSELADWILSLSAGATPEDLASRIREASRPVG
jgi:death-on-curing protein